ncbi:hypothetical protein L7F22_029382 [Adiantum nelumboides]|nr:hypothetical protein [Adiantum nelumboides]
MSFPTFNGAAGEDAQEFLDNLEIACLVTRHDDDATRIVLFLAKFGGGGETSEGLWGKVCELRQGSLFEYNVYEVQFVELWERWVASLRLGEADWPPVQPQPQQPPPPPPPIAPIPPLPIPENRALNVISLDAKVKVEEEEKGKSLPKNKGKAKVEDVDAMPIKRARQEEVAMSETGERRKSKENGESSSKKKPKPRQKLTIKDFALGESSQPYNLVDDVSVQGPKITWPQLLHLAPKVRRQWTKMVSTCRVKTKAMGFVSGSNLQDITPVLNAYVKGQRVSNVYVDGGAQICVMTEQTMHRLGLKVNAPAPCKAKMANNSKVKCLGVINALKIKVCEIEVEVDIYVMPTKGEGYPIILGRPWLMAMQARQDWGTVMLELQPHKGAKKGNAIHIDLKDGKHESLDLEISVDEFSSSDYSTSEEESRTTYDSDSSQAEIMGVVLTNPTMVSSINVSPVEEGMLTHESYRKKTMFDSLKVEQRKEVVLLGEACSPYLDGAYTLKLDKAATGIAIYNEKGAKLFGMNLVVDRSLFFDSLLSNKHVKIPWICDSQSLVSQDWKGEELVNEFVGTQRLPTKENQEAGVAASEPLYEVITTKKLLQVPLSQQKERWLDAMHLLEIEALPEDPNKRWRWLIRKATRYKKWPKILLEA